MLVAIEGSLKDYAWGSRTAIAEVTGHPASGGPEAELAGHALLDGLGLLDRVPS